MIEFWAGKIGFQSRGMLQMFHFPLVFYKVRSFINLCFLLQSAQSICILGTQRSPRFWLMSLLVHICGPHLVHISWCYLSKNPPNVEKCYMFRKLVFASIGLILPVLFYFIFNMLCYLELPFPGPSASLSNIFSSQVSSTDMSFLDIQIIYSVMTSTSEFLIGEIVYSKNILELLPR